MPSLSWTVPSLASVVVAVLSGVALWSIAEYALHRFLGHDARTMPNPFAHEHTRHHSEGDYFAPTWKKALLSVALVPLIGALVALAVGPALGLVFSVAFVGMYVTYEWLHRRMHTHRGVGAYGRFVRRHHFHHHFGNPKKNHGVTSPIWDLAFGTYESPGCIRVPSKLRMRWLVDDVTGDVPAELQPYYEVRAPRAA